MKAKPIGQKVLLKPIEVEQKSPGGIILPDAPKAKPNTATVIAKGELALRVKIGDTIMFKEHSVNPVDLEGGTYLLIEEEHIQLIL